MTTFSVEVTPSPFGEQLDALIGRTPAAAGDGTTNDGPAFAAVTAGLITAAIYTAGVGYGIGAPQMTVAPAKYALSQPWDIATTARYESQGTGGGGLSTQLLVPPNTTGIRVQSANTKGDSDTIAPIVYQGTVSTGGGSVVSGFAVVGSYNGTTTLEGEYPGYLLRAYASIRDFQVWNTQGAGIKAWAGVSSPQLGNANFFDLHRGTIQNTRDGIELSGSDTNVALIQQVFIDGARRWAVNDGSLGATYINVLAQGCGVWGDGTPAKPASAVSYLGNWFSIISGQEALGSTNHPPATAVNDSNWISWPEGGAPSPGGGVPAWVSGMSLRAGGAFYSLAGALLIGCYAEACPPSQLATSALVIGGAWGVKPHGGGQIYGGENKVQINDLRIFKGSLLIDDDVSGGVIVGRYAAGLPAFVLPSSTSPSLYLGSPNGTHGITITNTEATINTTAIDNSGNVNMPTGAVLKVNGTQVVQLRETGWTAGTGTPNKGAFAAYAGATVSVGYVQAEAQATNDAAKAASQRTLALEAMLRTHGLIN